MIEIHQEYINAGKVDSGKIIGRTFTGKFKEPLIVEINEISEPKQYFHFSTVFFLMTYCNTALTIIN